VYYNMVNLFGVVTRRRIPERGRGERGVFIIERRIDVSMVDSVLQNIDV
jgi:hypothetical protein